MCVCACVRVCVCLRVCTSMHTRKHTHIFRAFVRCCLPLFFNQISASE